MASLFVGKQVHYFAGIHPSLPEQMAMVVGIAAPHLVDLAVWDGERFVSKRSIHHRDYPQIKENPAIGKPGVWEEIDASMKRATEASEKIQLAKMAAEERIRKLREQQAKEGTLPQKQPAKV